MNEWNDEECDDDDVEMMIRTDTRRDVDGCRSRRTWCASSRARNRDERAFTTMNEREKNHHRRLRRRRRHRCRVRDWVMDEDIDEG